MSKTNSSPLTAKQAKEWMEAFLQYHTDGIDQSNFDVAFYRSLTIRTVEISSPGITAKAAFHFKLPPGYSNQPKNVTPQTTHGGAIPMFFDLTTSFAILACNFPGWESTGATRRLDVTYLKPPVEGDDCLIEAEVIQIGKRLAVMRGVMKREKDGVLLATCQHDKYLSDRPHYEVEGKFKL